MPRGVYPRPLTPTVFVKCAVEGCDRRRRSREWCQAHYTDWYVSGERPTRPFTDRARFEKFIDKRGESQCWEWQSTRNKRGYGKFWLNGATRAAHRISYEMSKGPIPEGMLIRHTCDNPPCVNPAHLLVGDEKDNARDALERGRYPRGETQGRSKLTVAQVDEIRRNWADKSESQTSMARRFGVSRSAVQFVASGHRWKGIGELA